MAWSEHLAGGDCGEEYLNIRLGWTAYLALRSVRPHAREKILRYPGYGHIPAVVNFLSRVIFVLIVSTSLAYITIPKNKRKTKKYLS